MKMRALTEEETRIFFEKLAKYIGKNIRYLIDRPDGEFCFRLVKDRVYYMSETLMKEAISCGRDELVSVGVCFGKFSKTLKFRLHITALPYIAQVSNSNNNSSRSNATALYYYNHYAPSVGLSKADRLCWRQSRDNFECELLTATAAT